MRETPGGKTKGFKGLPRAQDPGKIQQVVAKVQEETRTFRHPAAQNKEDDSLARVYAAFEAFDNAAMGSSGSQEKSGRTYSVRDAGIRQINPNYGNGGVQKEPKVDMNTGPQFNDTDVFEMLCDRPGCNFKTWRSSNPTAIPGILAQLELHIRDKHSNERGPQEESAGRRAFIEATKQTVVLEGVDNRSSILHEVRLRPGILDHKMGARMTPTVQTSCYCYPDFAHYGCIIGNGKTLRLLHDRSCQILQLQMFSPDNLKTRDHEVKTVTEIVAPKSLVDVDTYTHLNGTGDAVMAIDNYCVCYSWIHPQCYAAKALQRVVLKKFTSGNVKDAGQISKFFTTVTSENACRITRNELPLNYDELSAKWDREWPPVAKVQAVQNDSLAASLSQLQREFRDFRSMGLKRNMSQVGGSQNGGGSVGTKKPKQKWKNSPSGFCTDFNTARGCSNPPSQSGGCIKDGRDLRHGCSMVVNGRFCDSKDHNRMNHV